MSYRLAHRYARPRVRRVLLALAAACCLSTAEPARAGGPLSANLDLNGDGLADPVLSNPSASSAESGYSIVFGKRDTASVDRASLGRGGVAIPGYCWRVARVGDVDGDGVGDVALECHPRGAEAQVIVASLRGVTGKLDPFRSDLPALRMKGATLSLGGPLGDVNGDGRADFVVNAEGRTRGRAFIVFGRPLDGVVAQAKLGRGGIVVRGPRRSRFKSFAVAGAGDVNGDGIADVAIGDSSYPARSCDGSSNIDEDCSGRAWVIYGRRRPARVISLPRPGRFGYAIRPQRRRLVERVGASVTAAGDLDGDGRDELLVGALAHNGTVPFVLWGGRRRTRPQELSERSSHLWEEFGYGLEAVPMGDIDGDGADDLVTREPNLLAEIPPDDPKGSVSVLFGHRWRGGLRAGRARPPGAQSFIPSPGPGVVLERAGDVNGDLIQDLLVRRAFGSVSTGVRYEHLVIFGARLIRPVNADDLGGQGFAIR